ncbi:hypothetical protein ACTRXD_19290 [Nitrospira sp. T9]|uniref:hypothetical protein n=1 Tax=unclassified Nitrospira TaxID=2652172 RepID=UPI003F97FFA3
MSKRETPMIMKYWEKVGGTLIEEFPAVRQANGNGPRRLDAVILPKGPKIKASWRDVILKGQDVIVVQAKANRLGMYLMGQTLFSAELIKQYEPASIRSVALCAKDDAIMRPLLESFTGMEVVVIEEMS